MSKSNRNRFLMISSIVALALGFVGGIALTDSSAVTPALLAITEFIGKIWVAGMLLIVLPTLTGYLMLATTSLLEMSNMRSLALHALKLHGRLIVIGLTISLGFSAVVIGGFGEYIPQLSASTIAETGLLDSATNSALVELTHGIRSMIRVLVKLILGIIILSVALPVAISKLKLGDIRKFSQSAKAISLKSMSILQVYLYSLPIAIFSMIFPLVLESGYAAVGVGGIFIVGAAFLMLVMLGILYFMVTQKGGFTAMQFFEAMFPAHLVAMSSRSSLATMPTLMQVADNGLKLPQEISAVVIPFFISVFRVSRMLSTPFKYLLLVCAFNLEFQLGVFLIFLSVQLLLSCSAPGIPTSGLAMPLYMAVGIPMEGYLLLHAVEAIPDTLMTTVNTTEVVAITSIVAYSEEKGVQPQIQEQAL